MREAARLAYLDDLTAALGRAEHQRDTALSLLAECRMLLMAYHTALLAAAQSSELPAAQGRGLDAVAFRGLASGIRGVQYDLDGRRFALLAKLDAAPP